MFKKLAIKPNDRSIFGTSFWSSLYKTVWPTLPETTDGFRSLYCTDIKMTMETSALNILSGLIQCVLQVKTHHFTFTIIYHSFAYNISTAKIKQLAEEGKDITFWPHQGRSVATLPVEFNVAYNSELTSSDDIDADLMAIRLSLLPESAAA